MIGLKQIVSLAATAIVFIGSVFFTDGGDPGAVALRTLGDGATELLADSAVPVSLQGVTAFEVITSEGVPTPPSTLDGLFQEVRLLTSTDAPSVRAQLGSEVVTISPGSTVTISDLAGTLAVDTKGLALVADIAGVARSIVVQPPTATRVSTLTGSLSGVPVSDLIIDGARVVGTYRDAGRIGSIETTLGATDAPPTATYWVNVGHDPLELDAGVGIEVHDFVGVLAAVLIDEDQILLTLEGYGNLTIGGVTVYRNIDVQQRVDRANPGGGLAGSPPEASFVWSPLTPEAGESVHFQDRSRDDVRVTRWSWTFGDGASSARQSPHHTFANAGAYLVELTVWDLGGSSSSVAHTVTVARDRPELNVDWNPQAPVQLEEVLFTVEVDGGGAEVDSVEWRFADGVTLGGVDVERAFLNQGDMDLQVVATLTNGVRGWANESLSVANAPPVAAFTVVPLTPELGETVTLTSTSHDVAPGQIADTRWRIGQDQLSGTVVQYVFAADGDMPVRLTVMDDDGATSDVTRAVHVLNPPPIVSISATPVLPNPGDVVRFVAIVEDDDPPKDAVWTLWNGAVRHGLTFNQAFIAGGSYTIRLEVTDIDDAVGTASTVFRVNFAPTVAIESPSRVVLTGDPAVLNAVVSDPDGDAVHIGWHVDGRPAGTGPTQSLVWTDNGNHTVRLTGTDTNGARRSVSVPVVVLNRPPTANPAVLQGVVNVMQPVTLVARATDADGQVIGVEWRKNGQVIGSGQSFQHTFLHAGQVTLDVFVTDDDGARVRVPYTMHVNQPPTLSTRVTPREISAGEAVTFEANADDPEGGLVSVLWTFGDGAISSATHVQHAYEEPGTYTARVTATDPVGGRRAQSFTITVTIPPLFTDLDASPRTPRSGQTVTFDIELPEDREIESAEWSFGDGSTLSTGEGVTSVTHTYEEPRTFQASVEIFADHGSTRTESLTVRVTGAIEHLVRFEPLLPDGQCVNTTSPAVAWDLTNLVTGRHVALRGNAQHWVRTSCSLSYVFPAGSWSVGDGLDLVGRIGEGVTLRTLDFDVDAALAFDDFTVDSASLDLRGLLIAPTSEGTGGEWNHRSSDPLRPVYATGDVRWAEGTPTRDYEISFHVSYRGPYAALGDGIHYSEWAGQTAGTGRFGSLVPAPLFGTNQEIQQNQDPQSVSFAYLPGQYTVVAQVTSGAETSTGVAHFVQDPNGIIDALRAAGILEGEG